VAGGDSKSIKTQECLTIGLKGDQTLKASGGFLSVDWTLDPFTFSAGARVSNEDLGGSTTSPRVSVVYKVDESSVLRLGYFTSTRSPMLQERDNVIGNSPAVTSLFTANPDLKSEKVDSLELGYRKAWPKWSLDLTVFHVNMKDLIVNKTVGLHASGKPITQWQNVADSFTDSGLEVTLTGELASGWLLGFNGSTASFKDPIYATGEQADFAPKAQGNLWTRFRKGMFFGFAAVQHVGSYTVSMPGGTAGIRQTLDAVTQFHVHAGVEPWKGLSVSLYGVNATKATTPTTNSAVLNQFGIRYARRELGLQAGYRF
jgi:outer membrane receptor protein involved in Fe transport